jgi:transposase
MPTAAEFRDKIAAIAATDPAAKGLLQELADYSQALETRLWLLERRTFGRSSEQYIDPSQPDLFNEVEGIAGPDAGLDDNPADEDDHKTDVSGHRRKKRRAQIALPADLPRSEHVHSLAADARRCPCCAEVMAEIGEDVSEKLHVVPATVTVEKHLYKKYACENKMCGEAPKQAPREPSVIPKIKATEATLAFIAVQKYLFAVPLYRQEYLFRNAGVELSRYVMSLWMIKLAAALKPLYLTLEEMLLAGSYLHMDETTLQVLREPGRAATTKSYVWVRTGSVHSQGPPIVLYHYSPNRSADVAKTLLGDFCGTLQTDDYAAYASALKGREGIRHVLCWDHARRYFWDAFQQIGKDKRANTTADRVLKLIGKLYKIEARTKELEDEARQVIRQAESLPILEEIRRLCADKRPGLGKATLTAKAIDYMFDNWAELMLFVADGAINISNSPAEQRIRPFAVGRRNWLFANTTAGAEASSIIYSVLETAKLNGLDPTEYLSAALKGLAVAERADDLGLLLPLRRNMVR